jgi:hypothetical protein
LDLIDSSIRAVFNTSEVLRPDDIKGTAQSLREAVGNGNGWPLLSQVAGKVIFCFDYVVPGYVAGARRWSFALLSCLQFTGNFKEILLAACLLWHIPL